jgi:hypothetical protein
MKQIAYFLAFSSLVLSTSFAHSQTPAKRISIPYKPDPAFTIDGDLSDWNNVPGTLEFNTAQQVTYGTGKWDGAKDLSANVQLAWRGESLFVAAHVTDADFRQTQRGANLWKGDHLEIYLDTSPQSDAANKLFGERQFQIGLSPGNFQHTGDALTDIAPEAYMFQPAGALASGSQVAAQRTADGYTVEASIPWTDFHFKPQVGMPLGIEVAVSDTDGVEAAQEKMMTISTARWERSRARLLPAVIANADGSAPAPITETALFKDWNLKPGATQKITFDAPAVPDGYRGLLSLLARLDTPKAGGYTFALDATLNGTPLDVKRLANKKASEERVNGVAQSMASGNSFTVPYAPDFDATDKSTSYALKNAKAALLEFNVTDLLKKTGNVLEIKNAVRAPIDRTLMVGNARLVYDNPPPPKVLLGPPSGAIPMIAPQAVKPVNYEIAQQSDNAFAVKFDKSTFNVSSQYSTPAGKWETGSNKYFSAKRDIQKQGEWIVVRDTFTNLTNENLPLMHRDQVNIKPDKVWLGGLSPSGVVGTSNKTSNPTVFAVQAKTGIGLLPLDDVFQVHIQNYSTGDAIGLADNNLVLKPKSTYTAEWAIVPVASADYFDFINATRRLLDTNFSFDGSFAFMRADPRYEGKWSDQQIIDFAKYKDAKYLSINIGYPNYKGRPPQGTAFQQIDHTAVLDAIARRRKLVPNAKQLNYFHCFIDVADEAPEKFKDSRVIMPDGKQADYGKDYLKLFLPTQTNSYGAAIGKNIDIILNDFKLDGVYWDELSRSRYSYTYGENQWDGVSADIDPKTMQITRLKGSVTLLSLPWRLEHAKDIMKRGILIANGGNPPTSEMRALHFPAFNETGSITNCVNSQLYSPIALGDHLTERSEEDAYHTMLKALDYGCVYYWYFDLTVIPKYHTLTQYMFPITPVELHEGYIIGKERIITNRSGVFGWNDNAKHEVHVFDNTGREVLLDKLPKGTVAKTYQKDGKTWTEIRIGEDWSAAIVRK